MYFRKYSKAELRWYRAGYGVVIDYVAKKLRWNVDSNLKPRLLWRYGYNQYQAGKYDQALVTFERLDGLLKDEKDNKNLLKTINMSKIYQFMARCNIYLYLINTDQAYLEKAYSFYEKATKKILTIEASVRVPQLLFETARCFEFFGSYETAMDVYGKILAQYPTFRGYFVTLFRTAVIGRHLASIATDAETKTDTIDKCIDILLFLLESPPPQIADVLLVFTYARTLELSNDNQIKFRAVSVYHSLFLCCKNRNYANAHLPSTEEKAWLADPQTWMTLADLFESMNEFLMAKEAFQRYIDELNRNLRKDLTANLTPELSLILAKRFLKYQNPKEAIKYADYGYKIDRYHPAVRQFLQKYSESHQQLFQAERNAVHLIRQFWKFRCWSLSFIRKLKAKTIADLESFFHTRTGRYNLRTRELLAYYCKDKYRALFAFEDTCAMKIQQWWQRQLQKFHRQQKIRKRINLQASELLHNYQPYHAQLSFQLVKDPIAIANLRQQIIRISQHRFIGKRHPIHPLAEHIQLQSKAIGVIIRAIKSYQLRKNIYRLILERHRRNWIHCETQAIKIQTQIRIFLSRRKMLFQRIRKLRKVRAARRIQDLWGYYMTTFTHVRQLRKHQKIRIAARAVLKRRLGPHLRVFLQLRREQKAIAQRRQEKVLQRARDMQVSQEIVLAAIKIQKLFRANYQKSWMAVSRRLLQLRNKLKYSQLYQQLIFPQLYGEMMDIEVINSTFNPILSHCLYHNPGIDSKSKEFQSLLLQSVVYCPHDGMDVMDYQLLGNVLVTTCCRIQVLIFDHCQLFQHLRKLPKLDDVKDSSATVSHNEKGTSHPSMTLTSLQAIYNLSNMIPPSSQPLSSRPSTTASSTSPPRSSSSSTRPSKIMRLQNLSQAQQVKAQNQSFVLNQHYWQVCKQFFEQLKHCMSLKILVIHGGQWSDTAIEYLFRLIQLHNPRIQSFFLESLPLEQKSLHHIIALSSSRLLKDYFNYSIPGIKILSLHGCHLADEDIQIISEGLRVNTSLETLILSLNLITDDGYLTLLQALADNPKHILQTLDLQYNFIRCMMKVKRQLALYRLQSLKYFLTINCRHNPILDGFDPIDYSVQTKLPPQLIIEYDDIALQKQFRERKLLMKMYQLELQKPSARRQLLSVAKALPDQSSDSLSSPQKSSQTSNLLVTSSSSLTMAPTTSNPTTITSSSSLFHKKGFYTSSDPNIIFYQTENFLEELEQRVTGSRSTVSRTKKRPVGRSTSGITLPPLSVSQSSEGIPKDSFKQVYGPTMMKFVPTSSQSSSGRSKSAPNDDFLRSKTWKESLPRKPTYKLPY